MFHGCPKHCIDEEHSARGVRKKQGKKQGKKQNKKKEKEKKSNLVKFNLNWGKKHAPYAKEQCSLKADIIHVCLQNATSLLMFFLCCN